MVGIGIVGIGFMGMIHYLAARRLAGGRVVAVCSRDPKKLAGDWTGIKGNFGPRGDPDGPLGAARYVATSTSCWRTPMSAGRPLRAERRACRAGDPALEAGKHVLVEKPIALSTDGCRTDAGRGPKASGKMLMVAHVLPFFPEFAFAAEAVASGRYGSLQAAHLKRVIAKPGLVERDRRRGSERRAGDRPAYPRHPFHRPALRRAEGGPSRGVVDGGAVVHLTTQYLYDEPTLAVSAVSGALEPAGPAVHARVRVLPGAGDARVRVRQPGRAGARGDAAVGDPARWDGRAAGRWGRATRSTPSRPSWRWPSRRWPAGTPAAGSRASWPGRR